MSCYVVFLSVAWHGTIPFFCPFQRPCVSTPGEGGREVLNHDEITSSRRGKSVGEVHFEASFPICRDVFGTMPRREGRGYIYINI